MSNSILTRCIIKHKRDRAASNPRQAADSVATMAGHIGRTVDAMASHAAAVVGAKTDDLIASPGVQAIVSRQSGDHVCAEERVLVVDDDQDTCSNLSDILTDVGYVVDVAYGGLAALAFLELHPYGLALLDYKLPSMNGVELFERMRQRQPHVEGLLVTGYATIKLTAQALASGIRNVLEKPVEMSTLMPMIRGVFAGVR